MTVDEKLDLLIDDVKDLKDDVEVLKRSAAITETEIAPKVQILLENHTDLARNVNIAKDLDSRVGMLEFQMKVMQEMLDAIRDKIA